MVPSPGRPLATIGTFIAASPRFAKPEVSAAGRARQNDVAAVRAAA
jgi:hypothetical protein